MSKKTYSGDTSGYTGDAKIYTDEQGHTISVSPWTGEHFNLTKFFALRNDYIDCYVHLKIEALTVKQRKPYMKELKVLRKRLDKFVCLGHNDISKLKK